MNYLYALMGVAMISGIMSMLEISTSLNKQGLLSKPPLDPYFSNNSNAPAADRVFLQALENANPSWETGMEFCNQLKLEATNISNIVSNYTVQEGSKSSHQKLINSCALVSPNHRVIISYQNPSINTYGLFSCINNTNLYCNIED